MSLEYAILVSLRERAGSGYELARRFDKSIGYFWAASHQQIYRSLKRMVELGWVDCDQVAQLKRPDKKVYRVSDAGAEELRRWIAEPAATRNDLTVKLRGASFGDVAKVRDEFARQRDLHVQRLSLYREIERRDFGDPAKLTGQALHQHLVLRGGIRTEQALLEWCEDAIRALDDDQRG
ncbi:PadR family transcriptional regulator [Saccharopolyspora sp. TS4A08]|uniref:PadR family transcriptional regulator n=1 Tax=Saccharopolyspora ipomoeae TaxID=3042027 RepID=A0ABT6PJI5_9PSEU|nr:PadR family transcriptional regulator [Saccharopolyspora sp. TS4A08]MDI2028152.1 PadR family transcriptional regulator [Saccharopolyspora sp. TS4A08]